MSPKTEKTIRHLGHAGLVPFVLLALLMWLVHSDLLPFVSIALAAYATTVVSFLGGIHWGMGFIQGTQADTPAEASGLDPRFHFIWGVAPSLVSWLALMMPAYAALPLLGLVLVACYLVDHKTYPAAGLMKWLPMRLQLTIVATLACVIGAAAV